MADDKNKNAAAEKAAKEAQAKAQREAAEAQKAKAAQEKAKRDAELKAQKEAENAKKAQAAQEKAKRDAELKAQKEAQAKAQREAAEAQKAKAAQEKAKRDAELKAQKEAENAKKAQAAQEKAKRDAELKAQKAAMKQAAIAATKDAKSEAPKPEKAPKEKAPKPEKAPKEKALPKEKGKKLTRKEKKEQLKEQEAYEQLLIDEGKIPMRNRYKPRGLFWRIFGVCLAFFMGIFATVGAVVGAGAILLGGPTEDLLNQFGFDAKNYISEDYLQKSIFEIYDEVVDDMNTLSGNPKDLTLKTFEKYTPLLKTYVEQLLTENLDQLGISLTYDEVAETKLGELGNFVKQDLLPKIELGPVLSLDKDVTPDKIKSNAPMYALSYGKLGVQYTIDAGSVKMLGDYKAKNITDLVPTLKDDSDPLSPQPTAASDDNGSDGMLDILGDIDLGSFLGLDIKLASDTSSGDSSMIYTLCYGTEGTNYVFEPLKDSSGNTIAGCQVLKMIDGSKATSVNTLIDESTDVIKDLPLGEMLGLNTADKVADRDGNALMYALCYGTEGEDYEIVNGLIEMKGDNKATTLGKLTDESTDFINDLEVDVVLGIKAGSDAILRTVAYGNEMAKGEDGEYLKDSNGKYQTEFVLDDQGQPTTQKQYVGGGKYVIENDKVVMLPDPNDATGKLYAKKTIGDLTAEDASLLDGVTLGSVLDIDSNSSGIMQAMQDWTLDDLTDQSKIESLKIGQILTVDDNTSGILKAMEDWTLNDLQDQSKIESLKIGQVIDLGTNPSGILAAMENWAIGDLNKQSRIERLKIGQILTVDDNTSGILKAMQDWRISDLSEQDKIDGLTLGDVLSIGDGAPMMLATLKDMSLGEISTSIDTLTLSEVIDLSTLGDNKILTSLKDTEIKDLGNAIDGLTVEDVFGDEIWSYTTNFVEGERPTPYDKSKVQTYYRLKAAPKSEVTKGWYTGSGTNWTKVDETAVKHSAYVETKVYVTREVSYLVVDYDKSSDQWTAYTGQASDVKSDGYGDYYLDAEGNRFDLEPVYTYKNGAATVTDQTIRTEKADGQADKYYYIEKTDVVVRYAAGNTTYAEADVERCFKTETGAELTSYHSGVWYLLLGEDKTEVTPKITAMGELVTEVAGKINNITLGEMYIHELVDKDPSVDIKHIVDLAVAAGHTALSGKTNLNELTVNGVIELITYIATHSSIS